MREDIVDNSISHTLALLDIRDLLLKNSIESITQVVELIVTGSFLLVATLTVTLIRIVWFGVLIVIGHVLLGIFLTTASTVRFIVLGFVSGLWVWVGLGIVPFVVASTVFFGVVFLIASAVERLMSDIFALAGGSVTPFGSSHDLRGIEDTLRGIVFNCLKASLFNSSHKVLCFFLLALNVDGLGGTKKKEGCN